MESVPGSSELGRALREVMANTGLDRADIARRLDLHPASVSRILSGQQGISRPRLEKWLDLCHVSAARWQGLLADFRAASPTPHPCPASDAIGGPVGPPMLDLGIVTGLQLGEPGRPGWLIVAEEIARVTEHALADPDHPWTVRWPSAGEIAAELGISRDIVLAAERYLGEQGVLVKAWVPRSGAPTTELWVSRTRAFHFGSRPTLDGVAAEIVRKGAREWAVLPAQPELAAYLHVSNNFIIRVMRLLAERRQAVKVRIDGRYRWRIIQPHEIRRIDPRLTAPAPRVVVADVIGRIRAGEFRYRLPDGSVHEPPFLSYIEMREQYGVTAETIAAARHELRDLGWIAPAGDNRWRLADQVPPIDRTTHPAPRKQRKRKPLPRNRRARELADNLITRIQDREFTARPFPTQVEVMTDYQAGRRNVSAAFELLEREGWIEFQNAPRGQGGRVAVLADPLPEQPGARLAG